jgi:F-type H+-transporting ATPase subunit a
MGHGQTWFSLLGLERIEHYLQQEYGEYSVMRLLIGADNPILVQHTVAAIFVVIIVLLISMRTRMSIIAAGENAVIPDPNPSVRNFVEVSLEWFYTQARNIIGDTADRYFPVLASLALFIFISNVLGLIPGFTPPTDNWNTTFACSIFVFLYFNWHGLRVNGWHHISHIANPAGLWWGWFLAPLLFPIELVSLLARPFSLAVRLASNMIGDHAVLAAFLGLVPILVPLPFLALGLIVCIVQTVVFVLLTATYLSLHATPTHDEHHEAEPAAAHT